jgi:hypothetical protein
MEIQEIFTHICENTSFAIRELGKNPQVRHIAEKIANFISNHYAFLLGAASLSCLLSGFKVFAVGFALGTWATRRYFSIGPGDFDFATEDFTRGPMNKMVSLAAAFALRILHPAFSILSIGFLAGHAWRLHVLTSRPHSF